MKLSLSQSHSDENEFGGLAREGKLGIIQASKAEIIGLAKFLNEVVSHLESNENCQMHFRDSHEGWDRNKHFDLEVNV